MEHFIDQRSKWVTTKELVGNFSVATAVSCEKLSKPLCFVFFYFKKSKFGSNSSRYKYIYEQNGFLNCKFIGFRKTFHIRIIFFKSQVYRSIKDR